MPDQRNQGAPPNSAGQDLYAQISAEDVALEKSEKTKQSLLMAAVIFFMRLTLFFDSLKRSHRRLFSTLGWIWVALLGALYAAGLGMALLLGYSYIQFPHYVQKYLAQNQMVYERMHIPGHTFSVVELYHVSDLNKTYDIEKIVVHSTFADLLQGRVKSVALNGVEINATKSAEGISLGGLPAFLVHLNRQQNARVKIESVDVAGATLILKDQKYAIPVAFSLTGVYGAETNISAPLTISEGPVQLTGTLVVRSSPKGLSWNLDINAGVITFPRRPAEHISGNISFTTDGGQVTAGSAALKSVYDRTTKNIQVTLTRAADAFRAAISFSVMGETDGAKKERFSVRLTADEVFIKKNGEISVAKPISITAQGEYGPHAKMEQMTARLMGDLTCLLDKECVYHLKQPAQVSLKQAQFMWQGAPVTLDKETRFTLNPSQNTLLVSWKSRTLETNAILSRLNLSGQQLGERITADVQQIKINAIYREDPAPPQMAVNIINAKYTSPACEADQVNMTVSNLFDPQANVSFKTPRLLLKNSARLNVPMDVSLDMTGYQTKAQVAILHKKIKLDFQGLFQPNTGAFAGSASTNAIRLEGLEKPLSEISPLFSDKIKDVSGRFRATGTLSGVIRNMTPTNMKGPLAVALQDVNFKMGDTRVEGMNTVFVVNQLTPLATESNQPLFIRLVEIGLPLQNLTTAFKIENQFVRLGTLGADIFGLAFGAEESIIPYKDVSTLVYLKNKDRDLSAAADFLQIPGWKVEKPIGGGVIVPLAVQGTNLSIRNAEAQLADTTVLYTGRDDKKPQALGKEKKILIRSGQVGFDESAGASAQINLDTRLMPSQTKKNIRTGATPQRQWFKRSPAKDVPPELQRQLGKILN